MTEVKENVAEEPACICPPGDKPEMVCAGHFGSDSTPEERAACEACQRAKRHEYHSHVRCPQQLAGGHLCHRHFDFRKTEGRPAKKWEVDACADCQEARNKEADRIQQQCTIDPSQPYGQHISLTCKNHPNLRWHTKNIDFIGARTIFFAVFPRGLHECECPVSDLIVVPHDEELT